MSEAPRPGLHKDTPDRLRSDQAVPGALITRKGRLYEVLPPTDDTTCMRLRDEVSGIISPLGAPGYDYYLLVRAAPTCPDTPGDLADAA